MKLLFTPEVDLGHYTLDENESHHAVHVLRLRKGDVVQTTDGNGNIFEAIIEDEDSKNVVITVIRKISSAEKKPFSVNIAIAPTKNIDRLEWFLEKATEIGIDNIYPIICRHSERKEIRIDRLNKVIISAIKQSLNPFCPILHPLMKFQELVEIPFSGQKSIASQPHAQQDLSTFCHKGESQLIVIGPEGDFSMDEIQSAQKAGFTCVSLGSSRLRTETAALYSCMAINFMNQNLTF